MNSSQGFFDVTDVNAASVYGKSGWTISFDGGAFVDMGVYGLPNAKGGALAWNASGALTSWLSGNHSQVQVRTPNGEYSNVFSI